MVNSGLHNKVSCCVITLELCKLEAFGNIIISPMGSVFWPTFLTLLDHYFLLERCNVTVAHYH